MKQSITSRLVAVGAVTLGALGLGQAAQAHTDVTFSIGVPVYVEPAPVYVAPQPAYVAPRTVYVDPAPVYVTPRWVYYEREREREWRRAQWRRWHRWHEYRDGDGDYDRD